uniref:Uncharacterized protein n=1 Tax=Photinus pyralis TaxID=7054 RepID=A0A1Y1MFU2_PHOPY
MPPISERFLDFDIRSVSATAPPHLAHPASHRLPVNVFLSDTYAAPPHLALSANFIPPISQLFLGLDICSVSAAAPPHLAHTANFIPLINQCFLELDIRCAASPLTLSELHAAYQ